MFYRIYEQDAQKLLEKPETGMGYQIINASQFKMRQIKKFVVYNSNLAVELDSEFKTIRRLILKEGYKTILDAAPLLLLETDTIEVFDQSSVRENIMLSESKRTTKRRHSGDQGATDNPKEFANGSDIYVRISAFEEDKRIDFENMKLKPGTFTTTLDDYFVCVDIDDDPIDRYALPNEEPIKWSFYVKPKSSDTLQRGIVQPAFNKDGGGIEAYFENGTSIGTYLNKREYGKWSSN